jgi:hypothetical protein
VLAKQREDQLGRFLRREEFLVGSVMHTANAHFQRWPLLDVAIPIRFSFPPGHHEYFMSLRVIAQDFPNGSAEQSTLAATMGNLHHTLAKDPTEVKSREPARSIGQKAVDAVGTAVSERHRSPPFLYPGS